MKDILKEGQNETQKRTELVKEALKQKVDSKLRHLALTGSGFVTDSLRSEAWPTVLGIDPQQITDFDNYDHHDENQVEKDVERSLWKFTPSLKHAARCAKRRSLARIIHGILADNPDLSYFQGFHDICTVFLLVCGERVGGAVAERVALNHIRGSMLPTFECLLSVLSLLYTLIAHVDSELAAFLENSQVQPYFALSWMLTWFAHDVCSLSEASRLFDLFLVTHPLMPLYVAASLVLAHRTEVYARPEDDAAHLHSFLRALPESELSLGPLIHRARQLFQDCSPAALTAKRLSPGSPFLQFPYPWQHSNTDSNNSSHENEASRSVPFAAPLASPLTVVSGVAIAGLLYFGIFHSSS
eukprot:GCRY01001923.1.p1 GENE.GCRY01001923.1~~GCRY01001923.1.p1  ORF type:complete len:356 (+),score=44.10 GCRY01001923.1:118-1185(+)